METQTANKPFIAAHVCIYYRKQDTYGNTYGGVVVHGRNGKIALYDGYGDNSSFHTTKASRNPDYQVTSSEHTLPAREFDRMFKDAKANARYLHTSEDILQAIREVSSSQE